MKSLDLFAGAGGMTLGFNQAGIETIGAIEIDRFAAETFRHNFPNIPLYQRDIYSFSEEEIISLFSGVDIIAGGPPCQGFSVAGPSQYGIIDKRNTLIMEFFRFVKILKPKYCVLENVKGILSGKMNASQKALSVYQDAMQEIGYTNKVFILQAADFGVPQFRERVVIISAKEGNSLPNTIKGSHSGIENWIKVKDVFGDLPIVNAGEGSNDLVPYADEPKSEYQKYLRKGSKGVTNHVAMKHTPRLIDRFASIPQGGSLLDAPSELGQRLRNGCKLDVKKRYKTNNQRLHPERVSNIVTASFQSTFVHPYLNRNLTAREGARLQSFPDRFEFCGPRTLMSKSLLIKENRTDEIGLSQYNQIGNAVPPRMAEGIARAVLECEADKTMTYDQMIEAIIDINAKQGRTMDSLPHCSNLLHQLNKKESGKEEIYNNIVSKYLRTRQIVFDGHDLENFVFELTASVNSYMDLLWPPSNIPFVHQTDFTSSIIPEFICTVFWSVLESDGAALEVSAQKNLTIECTFDLKNGGTVHFKNKRVDIAVVKQCEMLFNGIVTELPVPLMAIECKTNLDKNMISGIEHSVDDLKKTFPTCVFYVVTELSDFKVKNNYASSGIDEIYVLRKQKRSLVRKDAITRQPIDGSLILEITKQLILEIQSSRVSCLSLGDRMETGKLIGRSI